MIEVHADRHYIEDGLEVVVPDGAFDKTFQDGDSQTAIAYCIAVCHDAELMGDKITFEIVEG